MPGEWKFICIQKYFLKSPKLIISCFLKVTQKTVKCHFARKNLWLLFLLVSGVEQVRGRLVAGARSLETSLKLFQFNWETAEAEASGKMEIDKKTDDQ